MLKINERLRVELGSKVTLPEEWHEKIMKFINVKEYPYVFNVISKSSISNCKDVIYICESICKKYSKKTYKIALSRNIIKYLRGEEVKDSNVGFSFREYLPFENTYILITSIRNMSNVQPVFFHMTVQELLLEELGKVPLLDFQIDFQNGDGFTSLNYYTSYPRANWKFLFSEDVSNMTDYEKMFQDTFIHKNLVKKSCKKLSRYLEDIGATKHAKALIERGNLHDNSKITNEDELRALSSIIDDQSSLRDSSKSLSQVKRDSIKLHHKNNSHHPEHYDSPADMTRLDIMEMVCDWHARSIQKGTDLMEFVQNQHIPRFEFPDWMIPEILHYCDVLLRK